MNLKKIKPLIHGLFWIGWTITLLAFFEQCLDNGVPLWSTVFGAPILHHGYYGFIATAAAWILTIILARKPKQ